MFNSSLSKRILNKLTRFWNALKGEKLAETKELERLLGNAVKLYNKAIAQKGKGKTISSKAVDKSGEKDYDNTTQYSRRVNEDGREEDGKENGSGTRSKDIQLQDRNSGRRGIVSVFDDGGRTRRISEIVRDRETIRKIDGFAEKIYITAKNGTQEALRWHAKMKIM